MNIAVTQGLTLNPPAFSAGLAVWSREAGTPGSASWAGQTNAAVIASDPDFGTCLEITKLEDVTRLRFMGETPILPGTYLKVSARVKAVAGNLPSVRIAGFAGTAARGNVAGVVQAGPARALTGYGSVVEVSAIVGVGARGGVGMVWGPSAVYGHFGLDLTGANGGAVRIESIRIEDVTGDFLRSMMDWVDVRDFGARGDGVTNDRAAFLAADAAANGGEIVVPEGTYFIGSDLTLSAPVRFKGTLAMPVGARLALLGRFDFPTYAEAFGSETEGLKRAIAALLGYTDHGTLDLCGRRIDLTEPLDIAAICPNLRVFSNRRVLANGQIAPVPGPAWNPVTVGSVGTYNPASPLVLSSVANVANIPVGSRITGAGVGREVYVTAKNVGAGTLQLSQPLWGGGGTRSYSFTRHRYILDFSGMERLDRFNMTDIDLLCDGLASGVMLAPMGEAFHMRDCYVNRPRDRAVTSIGRGCQGMMIDRCNFMSNDFDQLVQDRRSVAINVNGNDTKIRDNRGVRFGHFFIAAGTGHMLSGNHVFQGDEAPSGQGLRAGAIVFCNTTVQATVSTNYIDNAFIEWTNEYQADPNHSSQPQYSFGGLTITGNTCRASHTAPWFAFIVVKPFGPNHFIQGLTVSGNVFKVDATRINRIDRVDTTHADLNYQRMRNIQFEGNTFNGVDTFVSNPIRVRASVATAASVWPISLEGGLPFNGHARHVEAVVATSAITDASGARLGEMPWVMSRQGGDQRDVALNWSRPAKGSVMITARVDNPD